MSRNYFAFMSAATATRFSDMQFLDISGTFPTRLLTYKRHSVLLSDMDMLKEITGELKVSTRQL